MKATTNQTAKEFTPIDLTITIESKRELGFLLALFNAPEEDLILLANENLVGWAAPFQNDVSTNLIYNELSNAYKSL